MDCSEPKNTKKQISLLIFKQFRCICIPSLSEKSISIAELYFTRILGIRQRRSPKEGTKETEHGTSAIRIYESNINYTVEWGCITSNKIVFGFMKSTWSWKHYFFGGFISALFYYTFFFFLSPRSNGRIQFFFRFSHIKEEKDELQRHCNFIFNCLLTLALQLETCRHVNTDTVSSAYQHFRSRRCQLVKLFSDNI